MLQDIIHLFLGVVSAQAETNGTVSGGKRDPHGPKHMGGFQGPGGAGRTGRGADPQVAHQQEDRFPSTYSKLTLRVLGSRSVGCAVDQRPWECCPESLAPVCPAGPAPDDFLGHIFLGQLTGLSQADDIGNVFRSARDVLFPGGRRSEKG